MVSEGKEIEARKRASRYLRPEKPARMRLEKRDKLVIMAVNDCRILRQDQVQRWLFPSRNTAQVRLQLLWQHGYLRRVFLPVRGGIQTSQILYLVDTLGVELLRDEFGYDDSQLRYSRQSILTPRFLEHTLGLSEIRVAVELACRQNNYQLKKWLDEKAMKSDYDRVQFKNTLVPVLPDGYFIVSLPNGIDNHFFVEYDNGAEGMKFLNRKLMAYQAYFLSGKCKAHYGTDRVRVLMIAEGGQTRLKNLINLTSKFSAIRWFWFTSLSQLAQTDILTGPIWSRADTPLPLCLISKQI
jgi:hypothetical protein